MLEVTPHGGGNKKMKTTAAPSSTAPSACSDDHQELKNKYTHNCMLPSHHVNPLSHQVIKFKSF